MREMKNNAVTVDHSPDPLLAVACTFCSKSIGQKAGRRRVGTPTSPTSPLSPLPSPHLHLHQHSTTASTTAGTAGSTNSSGGTSTIRHGKNESSDSIDTCSCRKPRARCSLCLSRLNTAASLALFKTCGRVHKSNTSTNPTKSSMTSRHHNHKHPLPPRFPFSSFTVFCATCRHSGHALHYLEWFNLNTSCPVAGCTCTCDTLDKMPRIINTSITPS